MVTAPSALIDSERAAMLCGQVGINIATCRPGATPNLVRATGCRLSPDRRVLTLLVAATPGAAVLDDVRRTGAIAVVFSLPRTHETLQLKGTDARIVPLEDDDHLLAARYVDGFTAGLVELGYAEALIRTFLASERDDLAAVQFTIAAVFTQTPGPRAGEPIARAQ